MPVVLHMQLIIMILNTIVFVQSIVLTVLFSPRSCLCYILMGTNPQSHFSQIIGIIPFIPSSARLELLHSLVPLRVTAELTLSVSFLIFSEALSFTKEFDSEYIIAMFKYNELKFHFRNWILSQLNILKIVPLRRFQWNASKFSSPWGLRAPAACSAPSAEALPSCCTMIRARECRGEMKDKRQSW